MRTELEQAATKWSMNNQEGFCTHSMKIAAFKAGVEWDREQINGVANENTCK